MSVGNDSLEIIFNRSPSTLISGKNGNGKCLHKTTTIEISIENDSVKNKFEEFMKNR